MKVNRMTVLPAAAPNLQILPAAAPLAGQRARAADACVPGAADAAGRAACESKAYREFEAVLAGRLAADMLSTGMEETPGTEVQKDFFRTTLAAAIGNAIAERSGLGVAAAMEKAASARLETSNATGLKTAE
jgi:hypothetical protein